MDQRAALATYVQIEPRRTLSARLGERAHAAMLRVTGSTFDAKFERLMESRLAQGPDPFGLDLGWIKYALASLGFWYRTYFRVEVHGLENVPRGRVLLIANHSGQVPIDGALMAGALFYDASPPRVLRSMVEKWSQTLPWVSTFFARCGQVVGVPENARRLLQAEEALLVFPEGARGINKPFRRRYKLEPFGLGFMRLALETNTPIVPVSIVGGEEQYINIGNVPSLAKMTGMPAFPLIPQLLIPGGGMPLPTKYRIFVGKAMTFEGDPDDEDAVIEEKVEQVRAHIQSSIHGGLRRRRHVFW